MVGFPFPQVTPIPPYVSTGWHFHFSYNLLQQTKFSLLSIELGLTVWFSKLVCFVPNQTLGPSLSVLCTLIGEQLLGFQIGVFQPYLAGGWQWRLLCLHTKHILYYLYPFLLLFDDCIIPEFQNRWLHLFQNVACFLQGRPICEANWSMHLR